MPCEARPRNGAHSSTPYTRPHNVSLPKSANSAEHQTPLVTSQQLNERSRAIVAARRSFLSRRRPVSGKPCRIDDREFQMIYASIESNDYPNIFTPCQPDYLAKYEILTAMYPAVHGLRRCKRSGYDHLISITFSGTLDIICPHCNVAGLCNAIPAEYQHEFDGHFARWKKAWEEDRPRREALAEMYRMVDEDLI
ncbi:hypothetical protein K435DRAFT_803730 [Dendrothele bispora CBS 962.96]|uniref:Uncharacterized protein n=1 Tax=Dendrothele bispora (strain CBS 962.96) TaxID=1314807 RepID=A0A4S8LGE9_DENBC|nr:hypothetical protein K435DRAFT_803730 [Dendrothele bispora CBS 962.96]